MTVRQKDIEELFSMFHDFEIVSADWTDEILVLGITIPWGSMWKKDDYSYRITLQLFGCDFFNCDYYRIKSKELIKIGDNRYMKDAELINLQNPKDIEPFEFSVQSSTRKDNIFELHCIGDDDIDFATITVSAKDYNIFDQNHNEISLITMKKWAKDWWDGIQKMWDEQKKSTTR